DGAHGAARSSLVGRAGALQSLGRALEVVKQGRSALVHLHGASGMGKSALGRHFLDHVDRSDAIVLEGRCYERESVPYKALDSLIDSLSTHLARFPEAVAAALLPRHIDALARIFPVLERAQA